MAHTGEKIALGVLFVVLLGFNSFFILGQQNDASMLKENDVSTTGKTTTQMPLKEISEEEARTIALSVARGVIKEIEEKTVNGIALYEIEIEDDTTETEIKINKKNGDILKVIREAKEQEEDEEISAQELQTIKGRITEEQAKAIALEVIKGGRVIGFEAEREDGRLLYEVEIAAQGDVAEVEIDAETGEVLEIEWGDDD